MNPPEAEAEADSLRPFRPGWVFSFFNAVTWQVALGTPMVLLAERLGASSAVIGVIYSFIFLLTPVQIVSTSLLPRFGYKRIMLVGFGARSLFLLPLITLAWMAPEKGEGWMIGLFVGSQFCFAFFRAVGSSAFLPWINSLLPPRLRGRYFSTDQVASGIAGVGTLLFSSASLLWLPLYQAFLLQYSVAFVGSWFSIAALARLPEPGRPEAIPLHEMFVRTPRLIFTQGDFRRFLWFGLWMGVAVSAIPPFCSYYLKVVPELSPSRIVFFTMMQYSGVIFGAAVIRSRIDRFGPRPFFVLSLGLYLGLSVAWIALLRGVLPSVLIPGMYIALGLAASSWFSATMKYLPQVVPQAAPALAFSVHSAAISLASGVAAILWGMVIKGTGTAPSVNVTAFQWFFVVVIVSAVVLIAWSFALPVREQVERGWWEGGLAFRPFRAFTYFASLVLPSGHRGSGDAIDSIEPADDAGVTETR